MNQITYQLLEACSRSRSKEASISAVNAIKIKGRILRLKFIPTKKESSFKHVRPKKIESSGFSFDKKPRLRAAVADRNGAAAWRRSSSSRATRSASRDGPHPR